MKKYLIVFSLVFVFLVGFNSAEATPNGCMTTNGSGQETEHAPGSCKGGMKCSSNGNGGYDWVSNVDCEALIAFGGSKGVISLSWNAVSGAKYYTVRVASDKTFTDATIVSYQQGLTLNSLKVDGLKTGQTYYYQINASNSFGTSAWSTASVTTAVANTGGTNGTNDGGISGAKAQLADMRAELAKLPIQIDSLSPLLAKTTLGSEDVSTIRLSIGDMRDKIGKLVAQADFVTSSLGFIVGTGTGENNNTVTVNTHGITANGIPTNGIYLLGGFDSAGSFKNDVFVSGGGSSAATWSQTLANNPASLPVPARWVTRNTAAVFSSASTGGKLVVMGGEKAVGVPSNDVWLGDGTNWTQAPAPTATNRWSARMGHKAVKFNYNIYLMGGNTNTTTFKNDVWRSNDGITWTQLTATAPWSGRSNFALIVFGGEMYVIGGNGASGNLNDVWKSSNGTTWTQVTVNGPWSKRTGLQAGVMGTSLYIYGGKDDNISGGCPGTALSCNDIWKMTTALPLTSGGGGGTTWTQVTPTGLIWSPRSGHSVFPYMGKLWLLGGDDANATSGCTSTLFCNDVWSSTNGVNWTQANPAATWVARRFQSVVTVP